MNIPIAIIILDTLLPSRVIFNWLGDNPEAYLLPASFAFGAFFAVNLDKLKINLGIVLGSFLLYHIFKYTNYAQLILVFSSGLTVIYLASNRFILRLKPKLDISYGIYLWGFLVQQTIYHFLGHIYVGYHCLLALVICILLALLSHVIIERPFIKLGKTTTAALKEKFLVLR